MASMTRRTREVREREERDLLSPAASLSTETRGREHTEEPDPYRTAFERDRDRILHSKAFRRLKHKTQVFINPDGDHFVTRLTHTLQVTQIGRAMAASLGLNEALTEAICLGHDVGHSPFGHTGEDALTPYVEEGEWLHSAQSVRVFRILEPLNLTWEVLDGIRAHSWKIDPPPNTPEGYLCRYADRIAYLTHDVEDALRAGVLSHGDIPRGALATFGEPGSEWISAMIDAVIDESLEQGRVVMRPNVQEEMNEFRDFMFQRVYLRDESQPQQHRAIAVIRDLVDHFIQYPDDIRDTYRHDDATPVGQAIDYVSGMTDRYALRMHDRLFRPEGID
jgi:dGTPase